MVINKFDGEYSFLSNFYNSPIDYEFDVEMITTVPTVEHAFQAAKTLNMSEEFEILKAKTPGEAKRIGRKALLRHDWEKCKDNVMLGFLRQKFAIPELREKLLGTGDATLIEGPTWHDRYWGICSCDKCGGRGQNRLGELLMQVREELSKN